MTAGVDVIIDSGLGFHHWLYEFSVIFGYLTSMFGSSMISPSQFQQLMPDVLDANLSPPSSLWNELDDCGAVSTSASSAVTRSLNAFARITLTNPKSNCKDKSAHHHAVRMHTLGNDRIRQVERRVDKHHIQLI